MFSLRWRSPMHAQPGLKHPLVHDAFSYIREALYHGIGFPTSVIRERSPPSTGAETKRHAVLGIAAQASTADAGRVCELVRHLQKPGHTGVFSMASTLQIRRVRRVCSV